MNLMIDVDSVGPLSKADAERELRDVRQQIVDLEGQLADLQRQARDLERDIDRMSDLPTLDDVLTVLLRGLRSLPLTGAELDALDDLEFDGPTKPRLSRLRGIAQNHSYELERMVQL